MLKDISFTKSHLLILTTIVLVMVMITACGGNEQTPPAATEDVFVDPLPADRAEMEVEGPNGNLPCGLAEVNWGYRVFNVSEEFPACADEMPDITVYCLNADAEWVDDSVSDVHVSTQTGTVAFEVRQEGICGLFAE